ncbi:coiled-coil domain-containing protein 86 [Anopheles merus]|uniref:coiled-coil domain-containing protein 86 n=1 Tax=Anopheles merus TaxID=30066 RepID=UPI001BE492FD|nr:coiled-coil domain-containing protein 86 [Anopheles merus]
MDKISFDLTDEGSSLNCSADNTVNRSDSACPSSVRGKPKSGRIWKSQKTRFSSIKKSVQCKKSSQQHAFREEIKHIKELSRSIKETRRRENDIKRLRREENKRRRIENERKSEIVQVIKNPAKIKRMRKKQLRMIDRRDISKLNVV